MLCGKIKWIYSFEKAIRYLSKMPRRHLSISFLEFIDDVNWRYEFGS